MHSLSSVFLGATADFWAEIRYNFGVIEGGLSTIPFFKEKEKLSHCNERNFQRDEPKKTFAKHPRTAS